MNKYAQVTRNRDEQESIEALNHFAGLFRNGWLIAIVASVVTALGAIYALRTTPLYEASTVIQIKRTPALTGDFRVEGLATTEMEILRSRSILSRVVQRLQLDIKLDPKPPSVGGIIRKILPGEAPADSATLASEQVRVSRFDVPQALLKRRFILTVTGDNGFILANDQLGVVLGGTAGNYVKTSSRFGDIGIVVARNEAAPGSQFILSRISPLQATEQLKHALVVTENAKQSNVIKVAMQGANPQLMSRILGEIVNEYLRQRSAEQLGAANELVASYDRQVDEAREAKRNADNQYARLLQRSGITDPEAEGQSLLQQSSALEMQLAEAQQRKAELSARIGDGHPAMQAVDGQIANLTRSLSRNAARRESLAVAGRELEKIRRDRQSLDEGMLLLFNQRSKLNATLAAARDDIRLLDQPETPLQAISPGLSTMIILSCFGGIALGIFASIIKNAIIRRKRSRTAPQREMRFRLISLARAGSSDTA
jgi:tyrosine-protein kinase Etk/Wzc